MDFIPPPMPAPGLDLKQNDIDTHPEEKRDSEESLSSSTPVQTDAEKVELATTEKADGLLSFKGQKFTEAVSSWANAVRTLRGVTSDEGKDLKKSLHANMALGFLKLEKWADSVSQSTEVLKLESDNSKALFRRSKAYLAMGNGEDAKADLIQIIRKEPSNLEYRRMYDEALAAAEKQKAERKSNYSALFAKPGLYEDKEKEREQKAKAEQERKVQRQRDFEDEMAKRAADGGDVVDFETWDKEEVQKKEAARKEEQELRQKEKESKKTTSAAMTENDGSDDYTEEEKKILRETKSKGYCYFRNSELSPEERAMKQKINMNAPTKIEEEKAWTPDMAGAGTGLSSWNSAGTSYEEKDMSKWAKACLKGLILDVKDATVNEGAISFDEVSQYEGDANAAVVRGTNRYFYDLNITVKFTYTPTDESADATKGELIIQPSNITASDDPDTPDWLKESRVIWRDLKCNQETAVVIKNKCTETMLCLVKGFENAFEKLVTSKQ